MSPDPPLPAGPAADFVGLDPGTREVSTEISQELSRMHPPARKKAPHSTRQSLLSETEIVMSNLFQAFFNPGSNRKAELFACRYSRRGPTGAGKLCCERTLRDIIER
jgi:hypothetical protein